MELSLTVSVPPAKPRLRSHRDALVFHSQISIFVSVHVAVHIIIPMWPIFDFGVNWPTILTLMLLAIKVNRKCTQMSMWVLMVGFCCWCLYIEVLVVAVFCIICSTSHSTFTWWWWLSNWSGAAQYLGKNMRYECKLNVGDMTCDERQNA